MLSVRAATQKWPEELAEVKSRLESAEQLRIEEKTQKQALQEALEKEKNQLLSEIATLQRKRARTEN